MNKARAIVFCLALPLVVLVVRMQVEGRALLAEAGKLDRGDPETLARRVTLLGRAARRLGGPASRARAELAELGRRSVPGAYDELRSAILATRWLFTPDRALLDEANAALAERRAREHLAAERNDGAPPPPAELAQDIAVQRARLSATGEPARGYSFIAVAGLILFVLACARALSHAPSRRLALIGGVGFVAFVVGLWRA